MVWLWRFWLGLFKWCFPRRNGLCGDISRWVRYASLAFCACRPSGSPASPLCRGRTRRSRAWKMGQLSWSQMRQKDLFLVFSTPIHKHLRWFLGCIFSRPKLCLGRLSISRCVSVRPSVHVTFNFQWKMYLQNLTLQYCLSNSLYSYFQSTKYIGPASLYTDSSSGNNVW